MKTEIIAEIEPDLKAEREARERWRIEASTLAQTLTDDRETFADKIIERNKVINDLEAQLKEAKSLLAFGRDNTRETRLHWLSEKFNAFLKHHDKPQ